MAVNDSYGIPTASLVPMAHPSATHEDQQHVQPHRPVRTHVVFTTEELDHLAHCLRTHMSRHTRRTEAA
jgi:hypothetical protein